MSHILLRRNTYVYTPLSPIRLRNRRGLLKVTATGPDSLQWSTTGEAKARMVGYNTGTLIFCLVGEIRGYV